MTFRKTMDKLQRLDDIELRVSELQAMLRFVGLPDVSDIFRALYNTEVHPLYERELAELGKAFPHPMPEAQVEMVPNNCLHKGEAR